MIAKIKPKTNPRRYVVHTIEFLFSTIVFPIDVIFSCTDHDVKITFSALPCKASWIAKILVSC